MLALLVLYLILLFEQIRNVNIFLSDNIMQRSIHTPSHFNPCLSLTITDNQPHNFMLYFFLYFLLLTYVCINSLPPNKPTFSWNKAISKCAYHSLHTQQASLASQNTIESSLLPGWGLQLTGHGTSLEQTSVLREQYTEYYQSRKRSKSEIKFQLNIYSFPTVTELKNYHCTPVAMLGELQVATELREIGPPGSKVLWISDRQGPQGLQLQNVSCSCCTFA